MEPSFVKRELRGYSMEKLKNLNRYQQVLLILLVAMAILFGVLYSRATSKTGFLYMDKILEVSQENGNTIYSGKIQGENCRFIVTANKTVVFQSDERSYGPYAVKEDPTAIPDDHSFRESMKGIEVTDGEEIYFRGGIMDWGNPGKLWYLANENGTDANWTVTALTSDGTIIDGNGNVVDPMEPPVITILELLDGPELTNKGDWQIWFYALIISIITAVSILFADELFRFNLAFQIRNADYAEPSEWEIASRYIGWTIMTTMTLVMYIMGLQ